MLGLRSIIYLVLGGCRRFVMSLYVKTLANSTISTRSSLALVGGGLAEKVNT